jgi:ABC-type transport system involved in multi-copper enzyme maturation permease subunit
MTEFTVMYLLTMALLTVTYLTNRYMLSEMFRSERVKAAVSVFVLFLLVNCSMMVIWPISYRLKGLGWF